MCRCVIHAVWHQAGRQLNFESFWACVGGPKAFKAVPRRYRCDLEVVEMRPAKKVVWKVHWK